MDSADDVLHEHRARIIRILDASVVAAAIATIPLTVAEVLNQGGPLVVAANWVIWLIFVAEYLVMLRLPPVRGGFNGWNQYDRRNWSDWRNWVSVTIIVLSFPPLPALFQLVRVARLVRLTRLARIAAVSTRMFGHAFKRRGLVYVSGLVIFAIVTGGAFMAWLEPEVVGREGEVPDGIWWAAVTTIGTGLSDPQPTTPAGQAVGLGLMLCGVAFVTTLAGTIVAYFLQGGEGQEREDIELKAVRDALATARQSREWTDAGVDPIESARRPSSS